MDGGMGARWPSESGMARGHRSGDQSLGLPGAGVVHSSDLSTLKTDER